MKRLIIAFSVMILLVVGITSFVNNKTNQPTLDNSKTTEVVKQKVIALSVEIKSVNGQLVDVREPAEYEESHADNAINIPLGEILKADFSKIDANRPIYVYCRSGKRAGQAKIALEQAGYKNVTNIGGLINWENQGDKVCSSSVPSCS